MAQVNEGGTFNKDQEVREHKSREYKRADRLVRTNVAKELTDLYHRKKRFIALSNREDMDPIAKNFLAGMVKDIDTRMADLRWTLS